MTAGEKSLLELIGGFSILEKVHKDFYDKVFAHPSLAPFFEGTKQNIIEEQQSAFSATQMGGENIFSGKTPKSCHQVMFITPEHFELRNKLLYESILKIGLSEELAERWVKLGELAKPVIVKTDISQCKKRYPTEAIIIAPPP